MDHIIDFLANETAGEADTEQFRSAFFEASLARRPRPMRSLSRAKNIVLSTRVVRRCAEALPLTPGARERIVALTDAFDVLYVMFGDRQFRQELRAIGAAREQGDAVSLLIATAAELPDLARNPMPKGNRPLRKPPVAAAASPARPAEGAVANATVNPDELTALLALPARSPGTVVTALRRFAGTDRAGLLLLHRQWNNGDLVIDETLQPYFLAEVVRTLIALNANETAHAISSSLVARLRTPGIVPPGEAARISSAHGRAALRSGRVETAKSVFRALYFDAMSDPKAVSDYFNATFATNATEAEAAARGALLSGVDVDYPTCLAFAEFFLQRDSLAEAHVFVQKAERKAAGRCEHLVTKANIALTLHDTEMWFAQLERYGEASGLRIAGLEPDEQIRVFGLTGRTDGVEPLGVRVSVVMTSFNSAPTIDRAARSVLAQHGCDVELLIVDDCSEDESRAVITRLAAEDPRVRPLFNTTNMGTYASKNWGMSVATGDVFAFHDSDDWMHPLHLNRQLGELLRGTHVCNTSEWLRMRADGRIFQRRGGGYAHLNPASTMFRREITEAIGPFDYVRTGADAEYLTRMRLRYGWAAVHHIPACLALGLHHENSLTQSGATAFDENRYSPVRLAYTEAWLDWHLTQIQAGRTVELRSHTDRPFEVPQEIRSHRSPPPY